MTRRYSKGSGQVPLLRLTRFLFLMDQQLENHTFSEHIVNLGETTKKLGKVVNYCNKCDYTSTRPSNFKMHLKTHTGEKPNKCKQCDFSFVGASDLRMHLKRQSGEKSY